MNAHALGVKECGGLFPVNTSEIQRKTQSTSSFVDYFFGKLGGWLFSAEFACGAISRKTGQTFLCTTEGHRKNNMNLMCSLENLPSFFREETLQKLIAYYFVSYNS